MIKVRSIPSIYRNVKRWTEILSVLSKYGLADWLAQTNIEFVKDRLKAPRWRSARPADARSPHSPDAHRTGADVHQARAAPQHAARPGRQGAGRRAEAAADRQRPPIRRRVVRKTVETELGQSLDELFAEFDLTPIASASIGQVHRARLKTGERVVVKVQHAGIESKVNEDLEVLGGLAQLAEQISGVQAVPPDGQRGRNGPHAAARARLWPRGAEPAPVRRRSSRTTRRSAFRGRTPSFRRRAS